MAKGMAKQNEDSSLVVSSAKWIWNTLVHQAIAVITVYTIWNYCVNEITVSSWHVILCSLGFIPLMIEAILLFANDNAWTQELNRKTRYYVHGGLLFLATAFITAGVALEIWSKNQNNYLHFQSTHAITGLTSFVLVIISVFLGIAAARGQSLKSILRPVWFKFLHNFLGAAAFVIGIVSLLYGYETGRFRRFASEEARLAARIVISVITAWVMWAPFVSGYNQIKTILFR